MPPTPSLPCERLDGSFRSTAPTVEAVCPHPPPPPFFFPFPSPAKERIKRAPLTRDWGLVNWPTPSRFPPPPPPVPKKVPFSEPPRDALLVHFRLFFFFFPSPFFTEIVWEKKSWEVYAFFEDEIVREVKLHSPFSFFFFFFPPPCIGQSHPAPTANLQVRIFAMSANYVGGPSNPHRFFFPPLLFFAVATYESCSLSQRPETSPLFRARIADS